MKKRCAWVPDDELYTQYHDIEWGLPEYDDRKLFEMLILEGAQAGLSWSIILKKRENFRKAFDAFDPEKIAAYDQEKVQELLNNPGIIRNRLKIEATVKNARVFLEIQKKYGKFSEYIWQFVAGSPKINNWKILSELPAKTIESDKMSKDLKKHGFKFVGSTSCYAFMQSVGMVNDHTVDCFRYREVME
jgi:DNA-3-methyladenine glycosylase I